jgi:hypothetical protein
VRTNSTQAVGKDFFRVIAIAVFFLSAGSAGAEMNMNTPTAGLCGCDQHRGIEMYVNNVIHDAQQRGITCESAKIYTLACFNVYCSICNDPAAKERCVKYASDYFLHSPGFCESSAVLSLTAGVSPTY